MTDDRRTQVRKLFVAQNYENPTGTTVLIFHGWLTQNRPDLLPPSKHGDSYQALKSDLNGLWKD